MGIRKNQEHLDAGERARFVAALLAVKRSGRYDLFIRTHIDRMYGDSDRGERIGHRSPSFLPWHRQFLLEFERALQEVDKTVSLPYWDWTTSGSDSTLWAEDFMGPDGTAEDNWGVRSGPFGQAGGAWPLTVRSDSAGYLRRNLGGTGQRLPTAREVDSVLRVAVYDTPPWNSASRDSFRNQVEGFRGSNLHNRVHTWVNGTMAGAGSPNDPVFWLHHCNIDRLWSQWQARNPRASYLPAATTPDLPDIDEAMAPWSVTPRDVLVHTEWYEYR